MKNSRLLDQFYRNIAFLQKNVRTVISEKAEFTVAVFRKAYKGQRGIVPFIGAKPLIGNAAFLHGVF